MKRTTLGWLLLLAMLLCLGVESQAAKKDQAAKQDFEEGKLYVSVQRYYTTYENPLHSEFIVNGQTVDIFTSDNYAKIDQYIREGWNEIVIKTKVQEPANKENNLVFQIGPMFKDKKDSKRHIMAPVVWQFDNGTDWDFDNSSFIHALGPDIKEMTLTYHLYWAGVSLDTLPVKKGDYVLSAKQYFESNGRNSPVVATVLVNGTPFTSFLGPKRQLVITPLLKPGKNEVKIVSHRVKDSIEENDIECFIGGPAEWSVKEKQFVFKPITEFKAMQGWKRDESTGQLVNLGDPNAEMTGRTIEFMIQEPAGQPEPKADDSNLQSPAEKQQEQADKYRSTQLFQQGDTSKLVAASF